MGRWFANVETKASFDNSVSYLTLDKTTGVQKNRTQTLGLDELLGVGYRNDWLEVELNGSMRYTHGRNKLQSQSNLDTWQFTTHYEFFPWEDINAIVCEDRGHADMVRLHIGHGNTEKALFFPRISPAEPSSSS